MTEHFFGSCHNIGLGNVWKCHMCRFKDKQQGVALPMAFSYNPQKTWTISGIPKDFPQVYFFHKMTCGAIPDSLSFIQ